MLHHEDFDRRHKRWSERPLGTKVALIAAGIVFIPAVLALFTAITMWLWNWLMPALFELPAIGFWQAAGVLILSQILFKGGHVGRARSSRRIKSKIQERMAEEGEEAKTA
jgi:hypothetical protein